MSDETDPIEYLLNAMENAGAQDVPADHGYYAKRQAVLAAIRELRQQARAAISETNASTERTLAGCSVCYGNGVTLDGKPCPFAPHTFIAPQEAAEPTREDEDAEQAAFEADYRACYSHDVSPHDIAFDVWKLARATPRTEAAAVAPDAEFVSILRGLEQIAITLSADIPLTPTGFEPIRRATEWLLVHDATAHPAAPSNSELLAPAVDFERNRQVRDQALEALDRIAALPNSVGLGPARAIAEGAIRALKSATPDAGKGETK